MGEITNDILRWLFRDGNVWWVLMVIVLLNAKILTALKLLIIAIFVRAGSKECVICREFFKPQPTTSAMAEITCDKCIADFIIMEEMRKTFSDDEVKVLLNAVKSPLRNFI